MGDLLIVMRQSDLDDVHPTSLRMAASELATSSLYSELVPEVRGSVTPVMYHEACLDWLGGSEGRQSEEALSYHEQWTSLNHFIVVGNYLQLELMQENLSNVPKPRYY